MHQTSRLEGVGGNVLRRYSVNEMVMKTVEMTNCGLCLMASATYFSCRLYATGVLAAGSTQGSTILANELASTLLHDVSVKCHCSALGRSRIARYVSSAFIAVHVKSYGTNLCQYSVESDLKRDH